MDERTHSDLPPHDAVAVADLRVQMSDRPDAIAAHELAEAERAIARNTATEAQVDGVAAADGHRRLEDRVAAWRSVTDPVEIDTAT